MWKQLQKKYLGTTIPVLNIHGPINAKCTQSVSQRLSKINTSRASALAVSVNSPGGFPVQSQLICNKIRQFSSKNNLKVYTFAQDLAASGGYFVLCCGDKVYADRTSIVGNIGVIVPKYNLQGFLDMTSIEYKQLTSNKQSLRGALNPFHNLTKQERQHILKDCTWIHQKFIAHVKKYRKNKLVGSDSKKNNTTNVNTNKDSKQLNKQTTKQNKDQKQSNKQPTNNIKNTDIFSGQIYTGSQAKQLGLIDQIGSIVDVMEKQFPGSKLEYQSKSGLFRNLMAV